MAKRLPFTRKDLENSATFKKSLIIAKELYGYDKRTWGNRLMSILKQERPHHGRFPYWLIHNENPFTILKEPFEEDDHDDDGGWAVVGETDLTSIGQLFLWNRTQEGDIFWRGIEHFVELGQCPDEV